MKLKEMVKKMNVCITELSGSDIDVFYKLIVTQYKEFIRFYRMIEDELDNIAGLSYEATSDDSLSVKLVYGSKKAMKNSYHEIKRAYESADNDSYEASFIEDNKELLINLTII